MANMSYCRMENTYADLRDCYENWDEASSESELKYRAKILEIAQDIVGDFGDAAEED
ncbi:hypothetical protein [Sulfuricurvum sp.]|uniref:hypothetical protein n=1 Tax=Sulfuricurvum sp. TaxID=2025608 RepID=UPI00356347C7